MTELSRRELLSLIGTGIAVAELPGLARSAERAQPSAVPIRTLTAGIEIPDLTQLGGVNQALERLHKIRARAKAAGFEVQTLRIATNPFVADLDSTQRKAALGALEKLDATVARHEAIVAIGPISDGDKADPDVADWAAELVKRTQKISFSVAVTSRTPLATPHAPSPQGGVYRNGVRTAAQVIAALSKAEPKGTANFRFAAAASVTAGTPFFPVAYHQGPESLGIGLESAGLVQEAFTGVGSFEEGEQRLRGFLVEKLSAVEQIGFQTAAADNIVYRGIDPSPAPLGKHSIGAAIEVLTGQPFGHASTLQACAAITGAVKTLSIRTCGYAGLMLPVLEDPVLAKRAGEKRYGLDELLLYSTVCGTGLDVVPIPGDTSVDEIARIVGDVATLAVRLRKPLSARLFPVPGKVAGEMARFEDPMLNECRVFDIG
jgi:uncharacterized protein